MPQNSWNYDSKKTSPHEHEKAKIHVKAHQVCAPEQDCAPFIPSQHSYTVGERGPVLHDDSILHETLSTFVNSTKLDRVVHTKGFGAFGYFETYQSMKDFTKIGFLQKPGKRTNAAVRFSLAVSNKGTPDTSRNVRGFSTKFYAEEGVFDLLCNHLPVFLVRDAMRFPASIRSFLPSPKNNLGNPEIFWSFIAKTPEATHFITWLYSDVGTIKSLRKIRAYSVNTYVWKNAKNERCYVKYHWIPMAGEECIDKNESIHLAGENPDVAGQDLYDTIAGGGKVEYELCVQLMNPEDAPCLPYDPLDDTKTWDEKQYPLMPVGRLVLNQNPDDYQHQVEEIAFSPMNITEGAELSNDKMLQGRANVYWDAQRHRLGSGFRSIPINHMADFKPEQLVTSEEGKYTQGRQARTEYPEPDNFAQAGERYRSLSSIQQEHLIDNIASELYLVSAETRNCVLGYFREADVNFAERVVRQMQMYTNPTR